MAIYTGFSHEKLWFSIAMLNYQRVVVIITLLYYPTTSTDTWSYYFHMFDALHICRLNTTFSDVIFLSSQVCSNSLLLGQSWTLNHPLTSYFRVPKITHLVFTIVWWWFFSPTWGAKARIQRISSSRDIETTFASRVSRRVFQAWCTLGTVK